jgi:glutamyl-tRNA reductase
MVRSRLSPLRVFSISHHTVGLSALPVFSLDTGAAGALHGALTTAGIPSVVLATCNRTEVYFQSGGPGDDPAVGALLAQALGHSGVPQLAAHAMLDGEAAAHHLLRVAAGLESVVVGEAEILGQVRGALDACPGAGVFLTGVVRAAVRAGRMARAETAIGVGAQSVASAAVRLLAGAVALAHSRIVVVGAGETGARTLRHLRDSGGRALVLLNRTPSRAALVAAAAGAEAGGLDRLGVELETADAAVLAVAVNRPILTASSLAAAAAARAGRRLTILDLSMPAAVEPVAIDGIEALDLVAVEREVAADRARRAAEVPKVEAVLARELAMLERWASRQGRRSGPPAPPLALEAAG